MTVPHSANLLASEDDSFNKRSDQGVDAYNQYELSYATSFGDIKVENATDFGKFVDFYRLGIFRKKALEIYSLTVVLLFPTIGKYYKKKR